MSTTHLSDPPATKPGDTSFFGHPKMLASLFSVEMWERFSFYGMQGILLYYMYFSATKGGLEIEQGLAASLVGAYGGGVYLSTILGAWLADRLLGSERVLFGSAILIMAGHIALALVPGVPGLIAGLVLVGVGSGGLKANATALVGSLYGEKDERRDAGFSIFYMGINVGGLMGPLVTGWLQESQGFHWGFGAAAVGMALGLVIYTLGRRKLPVETLHVPNPLPATERKKYGFIFAGVAAVIALLLATGTVNAGNLAMAMAYTAIGASVLYFVLIFRSKKVNATERGRVTAFIPLYLASAAFWALFQQQFTFIAVYSEEKLDRNLFGWEMPAAWVQSINPVFIIIFAGVMAALWTRLGRKQPGSALKFSIGLFVMGLAFLAFIPLAGEGKTPLLAIVGILFLFTLAELFLSPIGLSVTTKLAPKAFHTQMVALFFLSVSLGTTLAGILAGLYNPADELPYFIGIGGTAMFLAAGLAAASPAISKRMGGVR
ncbi:MULTISPECIES: peptide MFS transporter [Arthrobacter]|uniref:Peptide MFS transporter n=1 Tax=Arthrobacter oryzae TaxID=409290 RepID=A0A3N0CJR3_9MICC|nr:MULTISPECIES: peptide MFS transporter [Arthrobacter]QYF88787.1 peptide MFS transporter [Arthrobacter sp. PAMC25284]RNL63579.1 peptide MFS transporter [Arthrobacter oryzae]